jgi:hypothetical protein
VISRSNVFEGCRDNDKSEGDISGADTAASHKDSSAVWDDDVDVVSRTQVSDVGESVASTIVGAGSASRRRFEFGGCTLS